MSILLLKTRLRIHGGNPRRTGIIAKTVMKNRRKKKKMRKRDLISNPLVHW